MFLTLLLWVLGVSVTLYLLYLHLLPKPIKGIPYNEEATRNLLGDLPSFISWNKSTKGELYSWLLSQIHRHNSPLVQVFVPLFGKPWLILTDYVESEDILLRRNDDFKKADFQINNFKCTSPDHHIAMQTNAEFKRHRQLIQDLMTPSFLHNTTAPLLHACFSDVMQLWDIKARLAQGRPFEARTDLYNGTVDMTWAAFFGLDSPVNQTRANVAALSARSLKDIMNNDDGSIKHPEIPRRPEFNSIQHIAWSLEIPMQSPTPKLAHWMHRQTKKWKDAWRIKEQVIKTEIDKRLRDYRTNGNKFDIRDGLDSVLHREHVMAEREGKKPDFYSRAVFDEVRDH